MKSLTLIQRLVTLLNDRGVDYCHWKSNFGLSRAVGGDDDLDILVDRGSLTETLSILASLGFRQAVVRQGDNPAGISHYYGRDPETGELVHVHLFSRVLTGESFVKSHHLPFEAMLLAGDERIGEVPVPTRSAELVLFFVRNYIKYGSLIDLVYQARGKRQLTDELSWLREGSDRETCERLLTAHCPVIIAQQMWQGLDAIEQNASLLARIRLARQVRRRLRIYLNQSWAGRMDNYRRVLWARATRVFRGRKKNKQFEAGGAVLAFVGPEATGKSTLVAECRRWLGEVVASQAIHAGKPPSTWLTWPVNLVLPWMRRAAPGLRTSRMEGHVEQTSGQPEKPKNRGLGGLIYAIRSVTLAWDRRRLLLGARRAADRGEIVICDRYPSEIPGAMDSPRLAPHDKPSGQLARLYNWLAEVELRIYREIPPPDAVVGLKVSVETAKQRNRDRIKPGKETDAYLESRHRIAGNWRKAGTRSIDTVDTEGTLEETLLRMKEVVWKSL